MNGFSLSHILKWEPSCDQAHPVPRLPLSLRSYTPALRPMVVNHTKILTIHNWDPYHKQAAPSVIIMRNFTRASQEGQNSLTLLRCCTRRTTKSPVRPPTFADRDKRLVSFCTNAGAPAMQPGRIGHHIRGCKERRAVLPSVTLLSLVTHLSALPFIPR